MTRLILLPGLGADERMYRGLGETGFRLETPTLIDPTIGESLPAYASRMTRELAVSADDWVGGCSFGSMVASEIARQVPVAGLVVLAGALDSTAVAPEIRRAGGPLPWVPMRLLRSMTQRAFFLNRAFNNPPRELLALLRDMAADTSDRLLREGLRLAGTSVNSVRPSCPVFALHGANDRVLNPPSVTNLVVIPGAGHALVATHAAEVTRFLATVALAHGGDDDETGLV